jgi:hypothetical protein
VLDHLVKVVEKREGVAQEKEVEICRNQFRNLLKFLPQLPRQMWFLLLLHMWHQTQHKLLRLFNNRLQVPVSLVGVQVLVKE